MRLFMIALIIGNLSLAAPQKAEPKKVDTTVSINGDNLLATYDMDKNTIVYAPGADSKKVIRQLIKDLSGANSAMNDCLSKQTNGK